MLVIGHRRIQIVKVVPVIAADANVDPMFGDGKPRQQPHLLLAGWPILKACDVPISSYGHFTRPFSGIV
ncbi:hypothetical protein ECG_09680 [Echinococcus granulosus]|uniref:Uncharacterized protein n=1 Tax=Echinococcus granulosus TaxID=6210 RepID=W6VCT7_ECHGR|nr:hypothetical protein EGR_00003 [Echinococcus granulosus]EUB64734.1 hypothetical protein EGR_00003 [Echinococcus granulosus]KAH9278037.1 hypothetical protein ECG_09680 [Echinococcus granulosus]